MEEIYKEFIRRQPFNNFRRPLEEAGEEVDLLRENLAGDCFHISQLLGDILTREDPRVEEVALVTTTSKGHCALKAKRRGQIFILDPALLHQAPICISNVPEGGSVTMDAYPIVDQRPSRARAINGERNWTLEVEIYDADLRQYKLMKRHNFKKEDGAKIEDRPPMEVDIPNNFILRIIQGQCDLRLGLDRHRRIFSATRLGPQDRRVQRYENRGGFNLRFHQIAEAIEERVQVGREKIFDLMLRAAHTVAEDK